MNRGTKQFDKEFIHRSPIEAPHCRHQDSRRINVISFIEFDDNLRKIQITQTRQPAGFSAAVSMICFDSGDRWMRRASIRCASTIEEFVALDVVTLMLRFHKRRGKCKKRQKAQRCEDSDNDFEHALQPEDLTQIQLRTLCWFRRTFYYPVLCL